MEDNIIKQSLNNIFKEFADDEMFLSEADLQFELASKLKDNGVENLIVEYPISSDKLYEKYKVKDKKPKTSNKHIDLFFEYNNKKYFVELKYKLKRQINKIKRKGTTFELPGHGAVPVNKYAIYLDIERMEQVKKINKGCKSFVLFVTNDEGYQKEVEEDKETAAKDFPLNNNEKTKTDCHHYNSKKESEKKRDLYLEKSYELKWKDLKIKDKNTGFKYLLIDLNK